MIIVRLQGGLGNQMFQYAMARSLAHRRKAELKFDLDLLLDRGPEARRYPIREYDLDIFGIEPVRASPEEIFRFERRSTNRTVERIARRIFGQKKSHINEKYFHFSQDAYDSPDNVYLTGYWQSPKYFAADESLIRNDLVFKGDMGAKARGMMAKITKGASVCVNIRRSDFLTSDLLECLDVDYYIKASEIVGGKVTDLSYFVFSDDIEWCRESLKFQGPTTFVSHEFAGPKFSDYLRLMAACDHFIIPNSTFAWWAVWLSNKRDKIVIAPKKWFKGSDWDTRDLIPPDWIKI